jgi:hypothetical protein
MDEVNSMTDEGFFSYVFKLSKFKQADLLNFVQYSTLSIIPFMLLYYLLKKFTFTMTYKNSSLYILSITLLSILLFVIGIYFIDRIVNFIPTFSGKLYDVINLTNISILIIILLLTALGGYAERTTILLYRFGRFFGVDDYILKILGVKNIPVFQRFDGEEDQWYYEVAYTKAKNQAMASGASEEKANEIGIKVATKLQQLKEAQHTTDTDQILELTGAASSASLGTKSNSQQNNTNNPSSMLPTPTQMHAQNSSPSSMMPSSSSSTSNPYLQVSEGMTNEPEPANGALGGGFTAW